MLEPNDAFGARPLRNIAFNLAFRRFDQCQIGCQLTPPKPENFRTRRQSAGLTNASFSFALSERKEARPTRSISGTGCFRSILFEVYLGPERLFSLFSKAGCVHVRCWFHFRHLKRTASSFLRKWRKAWTRRCGFLVRQCGPAVPVRCVEMRVETGGPRLHGMGPCLSATAR